ncbi:hypothetical protein N175_16010 [Vibrio anguillarum M3]|nr:hypothetical protein N175_16010 [Vibrio anguillarum M3]
MLHFLMMRLEINITILLPIDIAEVLARVSGQMSSWLKPFITGQRSLSEEKG